MSFAKPPLTPKEKRKLEEKLLNMEDKEVGEDDNVTKRVAHKKEVRKSGRRDLSAQPKPSSQKSFMLRLPLSVWEDLDYIKSMTGISINGLCSEIIRTAVTRKLREINSIHEDL